MIPKIIHYCWFGGKDLPEVHQKYIDGWKSLMPEYKFKCWNELNSPLHLPYLKTAQKGKRWANMSNYVRLHALYEEGGIYLDTDVEVIKRFDPLLNDNCFLGFEKGAHQGESLLLNNAIMGASPQHDFVRECKTNLLYNFKGDEKAHLSSPQLVTHLLKKRGLYKHGNQELKGIRIYTEAFFYPFPWKGKFTDDCISQETYTVHHWEHSWVANNQASFFSRVRMLFGKILPKNIYIYYKYGKTGIEIYRKKEVRNGPFKGMKYAQARSIGSSLFPKLIGSYEECLHHAIYDLINNDYKKIINIGCGEGYYSIGFARLFPKTKVYAYDINPKAIQLVNLNAIHNEVAERVFANHIIYDNVKLKEESFKEKSLVFCDAEGHERDLFDKEVIPLLKNVDLIIEIHDFIKPDTKTHLINMFQNSHEINIIKQNTFPVAVLNLFNHDPSLRKGLRLIDENRPEIMEWALLKSKNHLK